MIRASLPLLVVVAAPLAAQARPDPALTFGVNYDGGQYGLAASLGKLVLTDTPVVYLFAGKKLDQPALVIPIARITHLASRDTHYRANADLGDESVVIAYDGAHDAEAPTFTVEPHRSAELVAKIKYRMRKLGMVVEP